MVMPSVSELATAAIRAYQDAVRTKTRSLIWPVYNVMGYGAKGDGTTDDTAAIQEAIDVAEDAGGGLVYFPLGTYLALSIVGKPGVSYCGHGATLRKNGGAVSTHILDLTGAVTTATESLTVNASVGDTALTVASSADFAAGDYVLVRDGTYAYSTTGRNQELNRVVSVAAGAITVANRLIGDYATSSSAEIVKLSPITGVVVEGLTFSIPSGTDGGCVYGVLNYGTIVRDCVAEGMDDDGGFVFDQSAYVRITTSTVRDGQSLGSGGYAYGFVLNESCHHCAVTNCRAENIRENTYTNNVRHSMFTNNVVVGAYDGGFNTHGAGSKNILITNNIISASRSYGIAVSWTGALAADTDITVANNDIYQAGGHGISIASANGKENDRIVVIGNRIRGYGVVTPAMNGIRIQESNRVLVEGNYVEGVTANASYGILAYESTFVDIRNNKVYNITDGYGISYQSNCDNINIEGNDISGISSYNIYSAGSNTNVAVRNNRADDTAASFAATVREGNIWGTRYDRNSGAAATVADGGTITHNINGTPTVANGTPSIAGEMVGITAMSTSTLTVAIKKHDGTAGTTQTIYWEAKV
jgi:hypothetical protein